MRATDSVRRTHDRYHYPPTRRILRVLLGLRQVIDEFFRGGEYELLQKKGEYVFEISVCIDGSAVCSRDGSRRCGRASPVGKPELIKGARGECLVWRKFL